MAFANEDHRSVINWIAVAAGILGLVMDWWFAPNELATWLFAVVWIVIVVGIVIAIRMSRASAASRQILTHDEIMPEDAKEDLPQQREAIMQRLDDESMVVNPVDPSEGQHLYRDAFLALKAGQISQKFYRSYLKEAGAEVERWVNDQYYRTLRRYPGTPRGNLKERLYETAFQLIKKGRLLPAQWRELVVKVVQDYVVSRFVESF